MDDFVAYWSRWKSALHLVLCAMFVAIGLLMAGVLGPTPDSGPPDASTILLGWSCAILFGLGGVASARALFDPGEQLRIGPAGVRWASWSDETIPWTEIAVVTTWRYGRDKGITLHLHEPDRFPGRGWAARLARANRILTGGDIPIYLGGLDRKFEEAMAAIVELRREATGRTAKSEDACSAGSGEGIH